VEDNELIALLKQQFAEADQRMEARFAQVDARFAQVDARFDRLEGHLGKTQLAVYELQADLERNNELIHLVDNKIDRFRGETRNNFKDVKRILGVSNEAVISRIRKLEKKAS